MSKRKQQTKDEMADALKALTIFLIKKAIKKMNENHIPKNCESLKAMKERLEKEESNRMQAIRMHEQVRLLLLRKKQKQQWERQDRIRKVKRFLHLPYKTWIEQRNTYHDWNLEEVSRYAKMERQ